MKVKIIYEGIEIMVDESVKDCLNEMKLKEENLSRKNRRHELLWDSMLIEGKEERLYFRKSNSVEDYVVKQMMYQRIKELLDELSIMDQRLIEDRFINELKYRELEEKHQMKSSTIRMRIKKIINDIRKILSNKEEE